MIAGMVSSVSSPSFSPAAIQTIRSVVPTTSVDPTTALARTASPLSATPSSGGLGVTGAPPNPNAPRGSLLNLTV